MNNPIIKKRAEDKLFSIHKDYNPDLLQTIRLPNNLHYLTDKLPIANYNPIENLDGKFNSMHKRTMPELNQMSNASMSPYVLKPLPRSKLNMMRENREPKNSNRRNRDLPGLKIKSKSPYMKGKYMRKDLINKQHDKIEAQIKRYNEILKNHKQYRKQNAIKRKIEVLINSEAKNNLGSKDVSKSIQIHGKALKSPLQVKYSSVKKKSKLAPLNNRLPKIPSNNILKRRPRNLYQNN